MSPEQVTPARLETDNKTKHKLIQHIYKERTAAHKKAISKYYHNLETFMQSNKKALDLSRIERNLLMNEEERKVALKRDKEWVAKVQKETNPSEFKVALASDNYPLKHLMVDIAEEEMLTDGKPVAAQPAGKSKWTLQALLRAGGKTIPEEYAGEEDEDKERSYHSLYKDDEKIVLPTIDLNLQSRKELEMLLDKYSLELKIAIGKSSLPK